MTKRRNKRPAGRPRDPALDTRILKATLAELGEKGFSGMSMEAIAAAAGVPKPTVYRRWSSKADLATAALHLLQSREPSPRATDTPARLRSILSNFRTNLLRPNGMAMIGTLLVEERRHPELLELFRERIVAPRRQMLRGALERGIEHGEVASDADIDAIVNMLVGSFYARYLTGELVPKNWPTRAVKSIWSGISAGK